VLQAQGVSFDVIFGQLLGTTALVCLWPLFLSFLPYKWVQNRFAQLQHSSWSAIWVRSIVAVVLPASLDDSRVGGLTAWHKENVNNVVVGRQSHCVIPQKK
jgi:hypothetical protein